MDNSTTKYKMYLAGKWTDSTDWLEVFNPYNNSIVGLVPQASAAQIELALNNARQYTKNPLPEGQRAEILNHWAELIIQNVEHLSHILTLENGKPIANSRVEVTRAANTAREYAQSALKLNSKANDLLNLIKENSLNINSLVNEEGFVAPIFHQPLGVVTAYTPFNFPANTVIHKIAAAIAAGNSIIVKPSEKTPITALELARLFDETDAPKNILSILTGHYSEFGSIFLESPNVDFFTMTGHSDVGRKLYEQFCKHNPFKRCHFELGGNGPQIVLSDFDVNKAAEILTTAVYDHNGSRCTTPRKILVPEGDYCKAFCQAATDLTSDWKISDPMQEQCKLGPLIDETAAIVIEQRVSEAIEDGAELLIGGKRDQAFYQATVLNNVTPNMRIFREENFGPVMCVISYSSLEQAIEIANLGNYGLQPAVMTNNMEDGWEIASKLRGGCLNIGNTATSYRSDTAPFGGVGSSGIGKEGSLAGVKEMCDETPYKFYI